MFCALLIIAFVLLFIAVLLCINLNFRVHFDDEAEFKCTISYLFITYVIHPRDEEKVRRKQEKLKRKRQKLIEKGKRAEEKDKVSFSQLFKDKGIKAFLEDIKALVGSLWTLIMSVVNRAVIKKLELKLNVAGSDAADTAIIYGYANSVVYPIVSAILENVAECEEHDVEITPDFSDDAKASVYLFLHLKIKPLKLVGAILENRASAEKLLNAVSNNSKDKKE